MGIEQDTPTNTCTSVSLLSSTLSPPESAFHLFFDAEHALIRATQDQPPIAAPNGLSSGLNLRDTWLCSL